VILFVLTNSLHCSRSEAIVFPKEAPVDPSGSSPLSRNFVVMRSGNWAVDVGCGAVCKPLFLLRKFFWLVSLSQTQSKKPEIPAPQAVCEVAKAAPPDTK
jgi:hypothetical protein